MSVPERPTSAFASAWKDDLEEFDGFGHQPVRMAGRNNDRITRPQLALAGVIDEAQLA